MGIPEHCTAEEEQAIYELQSRMKNELPPEMYEDETTLYRFLKARQFNLKKSEIMLKNHLKFRKEMQLDEIFDMETVELCEKYLPVTNLGFDKEGRPLRYTNLANVDTIGLFKAVNMSSVMKHAFKILEGDMKSQKDQAKKLGKALVQSTHIYDVNNLSIIHASNKPVIFGFLKGIGFFQDNYPEHILHIFLINVSSIATMVWPLFRNFLAPNTLEKVHMHGKNGWKEELLKYIDADVLPAFLGGNRTDPDGNPNCLTFINQGGKVPKLYFPIRDFEILKKRQDMKYEIINRQSKITIPIQVDTPLSVLHWEYDTKCYNIGFGLYEVLDEEQLEEIVPINTIMSDMPLSHTITGKHKCKRAGKYAVVFDNSYSWLHSKEICYSLWVKGPKCRN